MIRDDEIQRLINYAKGLGLKVTFSSKKSDYSAEWYLDNSEIIVYKNKHTSKIEISLSLIHEIGHSKHCVWEKDGKLDPKYENALTHVDEAEEQETDSHKKQRKIILDNEIAGTKYWHEIYKETDMRFPLYKLEVAMKYDMWQYEVFYETGNFPNAKERKNKLKEINAKYKNS